MKLGVHFLPYAGGDGTPVVDAVRVQSFVRECRDSYDIVVVDLPPFVPVPELLCARTFVDAFVLVVEWARIPSSLLISAVLAAGVNQNDLLGFVLNKVNRIAIDPFSYPIESHLSKYRFQEYAEWPAAQSFPSIVPWRIERSLARGDVHYTGT
jgi:succinoglycan biosynthesis transport protein ExoP